MNHALFYKSPGLIFFYALCFTKEPVCTSPENCNLITI